MFSLREVAALFLDRHSVSLLVSAEIKHVSRAIHSLSLPPFQKGGTQILKISERGEPVKNIWGGGNQKGGERFSK